MPRRVRNPYGRTVMRRFGPPPSAEEIAAIARAALERLPEPFAGSLGDIVLLVEDFADEATLKAMGIDDPFDLTGLYDGIPLTEKSVDHSGTLPERVLLFRRPILDEWAGGEDTLEHLVAHVLIHEVGHHFGLSDEDIHALEDSVERDRCCGSTESPAAAAGGCCSRISTSRSAPARRCR